MHAFSSHNEAALSEYQALEPFFTDNPYFLFNYAIALSDKLLHEESLKVALRCRNYWADYDLECLLGSLYCHLGKDEEAIKHYYQASMMCPSRFVPLYELFYLYKERGDKPQMKKLAEEIIGKTIKVESSIVLKIREEIQAEYLVMNEE